MDIVLQSSNNFYSRDNQWIWDSEGDCPTWIVRHVVGEGQQVFLRMKDEILDQSHPLRGRSWGLPMATALTIISPFLRMDAVWNFPFESEYKTPLADKPTQVEENKSMSKCLRKFNILGNQYCGFKISIFYIDIEINLILFIDQWIYQ